MFPSLNVLAKLWKRMHQTLSDPWKRSYFWWMLRFALTPRFTVQEVTLPDGTLWAIADITSFFAMYKSIFLDRIYDFESKTKQPFIVDCGANIGLSIFFFKKLYPQAKIIAFEPDPAIFALCQKNIGRAGLQNVSLRKQAVWIKDGKIGFASDHADGGTVDVQGKETMVETIDFSEFLGKQQRITFLKMDIEGAEKTVLAKCLSQMIDIPYLFIEHHSHADQKQALGQILDKLEKNGYRIHLRHELSSSSPFKVRTIQNGMDLQLNIFAWKTK